MDLWGRERSRPSCTKLNVKGHFSLKGEEDTLICFGSGDRKFIALSGKGGTHLSAFFLPPPERAVDLESP